MVNLLFLIVFVAIGIFIYKFVLQKKESTKITQPVTPPTPEVVPEHLPEQELQTKIWLEEETAFIFRLNEKIYLASDREPVGRYLVEEVFKFMNASVCALFLVDDKTDSLIVEHVVGIDESDVRKLALAKGESISGLVLNNKEHLLINDLEKNFYYKTINKESYLKNSFISVPLLLKGEGIGVLNVANKKNNEGFNKRDLEFLLNVSRIGALAFQNAKLHTQIQVDYLKTITALALIIDARDPYTKKHSENVTRYSVAIAKNLGFNAGQLENIRRAALLHDIGKIGIRDGVLLKPGKLTPDEFEQIKMHPVKGGEIVQSLPFLKDVSDLVRHHHERYDGSGYPDGKIGNDIELGARILAVADSFDAMTTDRLYRKKLPLEVAKDELKRNKSTQFDPQIVEAFLEVLDRNSAILLSY